MATLKNFRKVAALYKATILDDKGGISHEIRVEAPKGRKWKCDDIHELVESVYLPFKPDYQDLIDRMSYGTEICDDLECEWCNPT